jgi:hypothetical protein
MKKWASELNRAFSKDVQIAKKHRKKCSTFLVIKEMKIQDSTSLLLEWLSSRTPPTTNVGMDMRKKEPSYTVGENVN